MLVYKDLNLSHIESHLCTGQVHWITTAMIKNNNPTLVLSSFTQQCLLPQIEDVKKGRLIYSKVVEITALNNGITQHSRQGERQLRSSFLF